MLYLVILVICLDATRGDGCLNATSVHRAHAHDSLYPGSIFINGDRLGGGFNLFSSRPHFPDELVKVTCKPSRNWTIRIFAYYERDIGSHVSRKTEYLYTQNNTIYKKLNDDPDISKHFHCELINNYNCTSELWIMDVQFNLQEHNNHGTQGYPVFSVNGLILHSKEPEAYNLFFIYEYYEKETLNVSVIVDSNSNKSVECTFDGIKPPSLFFKSAALQIELTKKHRNLRYFCQTPEANMSLFFMLDTFNYDPYMTGLSLSKTSLKYKPNITTTIIIYEYAPREVLELNCSSISPVTFHFSSKEIYLFNSKVKYYSVAAQFKLRLKTRIGHISCVSSRNGIEYQTQLQIIQKNRLSITKENNSTKDKDSHPNNTKNGTETDFKTHTKSNSQKTEGSKEVPVFAYKVNVISTLAVIGIACSIIIIGILYFICVKVFCQTGSAARGTRPPVDACGSHRSSQPYLREEGYPPHDAATARNKKTKNENAQYENMNVVYQDTGALATVDSDHVYETISEPTYDDPYAVSPSPSSQTPEDVSQRPSCPLPSEEREENKPYIHYDTPYEFRIFRMGMPVTHIPDRFTMQKFS